MGRFGESQKKITEVQTNRESRVNKNLSHKKEPMVTRSIRMPERDIRILEDFFKQDERTFTQGVRRVLHDYMEKEELL